MKRFTGVLVDTMRALRRSLWPDRQNFVLESVAVVLAIIVALIWVTELYEGVL